MKAIVYTKYGPPEVLQLEEVEKPVPKGNEVLIKIYAATVSSEDCTFRKGRPFIARLATGLLKPKINTPGTNLAGEIETVGNEVRKFKQENQVFAASDDNFGAYAEYLCLPEEGAITLKPDNMSFAEAASICGGGLTALPFLRDTGKIQFGQRILVIGASGSVGSSAVQISKYFGAEVTGLCSTTNLELVKSLGADKVIDYTQEDFSKNGETYDIIFDAVGKSSFSSCKDSLKPSGIYLSTVLTAGILFNMLWTSIFGSKKAKIAFAGLRQAKEKSKDLIFLKELAESGMIQPVIDRSYPLDQVAEAHSYVDKGHKKGNVVLTVEHNGDA